MAKSPEICRSVRGYDPAISGQRSKLDEAMRALDAMTPFD